jgi:putative CocE/NonD family hydrolase
VIGRVFGLVELQTRNQLALDCSEGEVSMLVKESIKSEINVPIKMRDGTILYADVYRPDDAGQHPAILARTPYDKSDTTGNTLRGYMNPQKFVRNAYVVVIQDLRGTGVSEGVQDVRVADADDGYDTVEWIAAQPWCNGNVGMYGLSHLGFTQWAAAKARPPHLKTICPAGTQAGARPYKYGAFRLNQILVWYLHMTAGALRRSRLPAEELSKRWKALIQTMDNIGEHLRFLPLKDVPAAKIAIKPDLIPFYSDFLTHIEDISYWQRQFSPVPPEEVVIPALHICGWYDDLASDVLESYIAMKTKGGSPLARDNQKIIMGPWIHTTEQESISGELDFGAMAAGAFVDVNKLHIRWFDHWLKGIENGIMAEPRVRIFVMGDNVWRDEKDWPLPDTVYTKYYFHSLGNANSRHGNGFLNTQPPGEEPTDIYLYDPRNPTPIKGGITGSFFIQGAFDQQEVEVRSDVLVYTSPVLETDVEVTGPIEAVLWATSTAVDTDFTGKLVDVWPDGKAYNLVDGIVRARYRISEYVANFIKPGKVYKFSFNLGATSNVFKAGHRIRFQVSSSGFPKWDRNLNTGRPIGQDAKMKAAVQTIYHDRKRPSHIILPVISRK